MITGAIKNKIDKIWLDIAAGKNRWKREVF